jgi:hypothetical protein
MRAPRETNVNSLGLVVESRVEDHLSRLPFGQREHRSGSTREDSLNSAGPNSESQTDSQSPSVCSNLEGEAKALLVVSSSRGYHQPTSLLFECITGSAGLHSVTNPLVTCLCLKYLTSPE